MRPKCDAGISWGVRGSGLTCRSTVWRGFAGGDEIPNTRGLRPRESSGVEELTAAGSAICRLGENNASAAWRARVVRSRSPSLRRGLSHRLTTIYSDPVELPTIFKVDS